MAALVILILLSSNPLLAQDRQVDSNRTPIVRQSEPRIAVTERSPAQLRADMLAVCDEAEATFNFLARYSIAESGIQKIGYENISEVLGQIAESRKQIEEFPDSYLQLMNYSFPDSGTLDRLAISLRAMRTDERFQVSLGKAEKWFSENKGNARAQGTTVGVRTAPSAPAFIRQSCDFRNLTDFPSAADVGIAQGVALAVDVVLLFLDIDAGNNVPNPAYFIAVAAKAIVGPIVLGLEGARDAGLWCQDLAFNMQGALTTDGQFVVSFLLPPSAGGFEDYLKDFVEAVIQRATENGIPTNCASTRLSEGIAYYNANDWSNAYKKFRTAYANIAADTCVQQ